MSMSDPIADMLTRIRNAQSVNKEHVSIPASNLKSAIASVMQDEGYITSFAIEGDKAANKTLVIKLGFEILSSDSITGWLSKYFNLITNVLLAALSPSIAKEVM